MEKIKEKFEEIKKEINPTEKALKKVFDQLGFLLNKTNMLDPKNWSDVKELEKLKKEITETRDKVKKLLWDTRLKGRPGYEEWKEAQEPTAENKEPVVEETTEPTAEIPDWENYSNQELLKNY